MVDDNKGRFYPSEEKDLTELLTDVRHSEQTFFADEGLLKQIYNEQMGGSSGKGSMAVAPMIKERIGELVAIVDAHEKFFTTSIQNMTFKNVIQLATLFDKYATFFAQKYIPYSSQYMNYLEVIESATESENKAFVEELSKAKPSRSMKLTDYFSRPLEHCSEFVQFCIRLQEILCQTRPEDEDVLVALELAVDKFLIFNEQAEQGKIQAQNMRVLFRLQKELVVPEKNRFGFDLLVRDRRFIRASLLNKWTSGKGIMGKRVIQRRVFLFSDALVWTLETSQPPYKFRGSVSLDVVGAQVGDLDPVQPNSPSIQPQSPAIASVVAVSSGGGIPTGGVGGGGGGLASGSASPSVDRTAGGGGSPAASITGIGQGSPPQLQLSSIGESTKAYDIESPSNASSRRDRSQSVAAPSYGFYVDTPDKSVTFLCQSDGEAQGWVLDIKACIEVFIRQRREARDKRHENRQRLHEAITEKLGELVENNQSPGLNVPGPGLAHRRFAKARLHIRVPSRDHVVESSSPTIQRPQLRKRSSFIDSVAGKLGLKHGEKPRSESIVSRPYNVEHKTHVDMNYEWTGKNLDEIFDLVERLGIGSFGAVYKGRHKQTGFELAVKTITAQKYSSQYKEIIQDIKDEIEILKQLRNSNIVSYYGCWGPDKQERLWILMDLCEMGSTLDLLKHSRSHFTERQISYLLFSTLQALTYLHAKQMIHRDVKPANVLVTSTGDIKLADFGLTKQKPPNEEGLRGLVGSPFYMAPEIIKGDPATFVADIWSLGITAIELAEGQPPHVDAFVNGIEEGLRIIGAADPPQLQMTFWTKTFRDFVSVCLTRDQSKRPDAISLCTHPFILAGAQAGRDCMIPMIKRCVHLPNVTVTQVHKPPPTASPSMQQAPMPPPQPRPAKPTPEARPRSATNRNKSPAVGGPPPPVRVQIDGAPANGSPPQEKEREHRPSEHRASEHRPSSPPLPSNARPTTSPLSSPRAAELKRNASPSAPPPSSHQGSPPQVRAPPSPQARHLQPSQHQQQQQRRAPSADMRGQVAPPAPASPRHGAVAAPVAGGAGDNLQTPPQRARGPSAPSRPAIRQTQ